MGQPCKPTEVLLAQGTWRKERHAGRGSPAPGGSPRRPKWLDKDGRICWSAIRKAMPASVYTAADSMALAGACQWWSLWRRYIRNIEEGGDDYKLAVQASMAWKNFMNCASKLGLTPVDRQRFRVTVEEPDTSKSKFFKAS